MADDDYDDGVFFEDDYLYVEDNVAPADILAETSVPSPPYIETVDEDYWAIGDAYGYWLDIDYGPNEYYDVNPESKHLGAPQETGIKRKAKVEAHTANKRQKTGAWNSTAANGQSEKIYTGPNVIHMACRELYALSEPCQDCGKPKPYALLPEWKQYLKDNPPPALRKSSQRDSMLEGSPEPQGVNPSQILAIIEKGLNSGGGAAQDIQAMLMKILSENSKMGMDEILERLTASVISQVEKGGLDSRMGKWLTQNGLSFPEGSEVGEDDTVGSQSVAGGDDPEEDDDVDAEGPSAKSSGTPPNTKPRSNAPPTKARIGRSTKAATSRDEAEEHESREAMPPKKLPAPVKGRKRKVEDDEDSSSRKLARADDSAMETQPPVKRVTRSTRARK